MKTRHNIFDIRYIWKTIWKAVVIGYLLLLACANLTIFAFTKAIHEANSCFGKFEVCMDYDAFNNEWFALLTGILTFLTLIVFLILYVYGLKKRNHELDYLLWLDKRIAETMTEYDNAQTASYGTGLDYESTAKQRLISKGGKLRAYKEVRDYLRSH